MGNASVTLEITASLCGPIMIRELVGPLNRQCEQHQQAEEAGGNRAGVNPGGSQMRKMHHQFYFKLRRNPEKLKTWISAAGRGDYMNFLTR